MTEYLRMLSDPAHWAFELTLVLIVDVLIGLILWPLIKRAVAKHDRENHA